MLDRDDLWRRYVTLPPDAQREVVDFLAFLAARLQRSRPPASARELADEAFVGMWSDRSDIANGAGWVREVRGREWSETDG